MRKREREMGSWERKKVYIRNYKQIERIIVRGGRNKTQRKRERKKDVGKSGKQRQDRNRLKTGERERDGKCKVKKKRYNKVIQRYTG